MRSDSGVCEAGGGGPCACASNVCVQLPQASWRDLLFWAEGKSLLSYLSKGNTEGCDEAQHRAPHGEWSVPFLCSLLVNLRET